MRFIDKGRSIWLSSLLKSCNISSWISSSIEDLPSPKSRSLLKANLLCSVHSRPYNKSNLSFRGRPKLCCLRVGKFWTPPSHVWKNSWTIQSSCKVYTRWIQNWQKSIATYLLLFYSMQKLAEFWKKILHPKSFTMIHEFLLSKIITTFWERKTVLVIKKNF